MNMFKLDYYYGQESEQFSFFRLPKLLFINPAYRDISAEAKILYGLMLDRMALSQKNGWFDDDNRVYIIFTVEDIEEQLCCSHVKAVKLLAELDSDKGVGLIERIRRGQGQPSIIYVMNFASITAVKSPEVPCSSQKYKNDTSRSIQNKLQEVQKTNFKKYSKQTSGSLESELPEVQKINANNTDIIHTDLSDTESIYPSIEGNPPDRMDGSAAGDPVEKARREVRAQIEYDILADDKTSGLLDEIVNVILKVMLSSSKTVRIGKENVSIELVKDSYRRLRAAHILNVIKAYKDVEEPILNPTNYMRTMLYNAPDSANMMVENQVSLHFAHY